MPLIFGNYDVAAINVEKNRAIRSGGIQLLIGNTSWCYCSPHAASLDSGIVDNTPIILLQSDLLRPKTRDLGSSRCWLLVAQA